MIPNQLPKGLLIISDCEMPGTPFSLLESYKALTRQFSDFYNVTFLFLSLDYNLNDIYIIDNEVDNNYLFISLKIRASQFKWLNLLRIRKSFVECLSIFDSISFEIHHVLLLGENSASFYNSFPIRSVLGKSISFNKKGSVILPSNDKSIFQNFQRFDRFFPFQLKDFNSESMQLPSVLVIVESTSNYKELSKLFEHFNKISISYQVVSSSRNRKELQKTAKIAGFYDKGFNSYSTFSHIFIITSTFDFFYQFLTLSKTSQLYFISENFPHSDFIKLGFPFSQISNIQYNRISKFIYSYQNRETVRINLDYYCDIKSVTYNLKQIIESNSLKNDY